jgi:drug/metabolite transporter (DMT)-like permease
MLTYRTAIVIFALGLVSIASSQLLVKWRFGVLGLESQPKKWGLELLGALLTDAWLWFAGLLIVASAISWYLALTRLPLTLMLPIAGIVPPIVAVGANQLLGEPLSGGQITAIAMIAIGVAWLGYQQ